MPFAKWQADRLGNQFDVNSSTYQAREGDPVTNGQHPLSAMQSVCRADADKGQSRAVLSGSCVQCSRHPSPSLEGIWLLNSIRCLGQRQNTKNFRAIGSGKVSRDSRAFLGNLCVGLIQRSSTARTRVYSASVSAIRACVPTTA
jgi:hypothetical protein